MGFEHGFPAEPAGSLRIQQVCWVDIGLNGAKLRCMGNDLGTVNHSTEDCMLKDWTVNITEMELSLSRKLEGMSGQYGTCVRMKMTGGTNLNNGVMAGRYLP